MAVTLSSEAQTVFFTKVLGVTHPAVSKVKALLDAGVTFEVSLYAVRAFVGKKPAADALQLSFGTTALMKGTVNPDILLHNQKLIVDWVAYLHEKQGAPKPAAKPAPAGVDVASQFKPVETALWVTGLIGGSNKLVAIKAIHKLVGGSLSDAKVVTDQVDKGSMVKLATYSSVNAAVAAGETLKAAGLTVSIGTGVGVATVKADTPKPVDAVIDLRNAKALGQKVHGTSSGSVYYCIAISEHVRIAARLSKSGSVSIRAEWTDNPTEELAKLEDAGVQMKAGMGYGSIHFSADGVPVSRVVGAFLVGTGINWTQAVMNGTELVVAG